MKDTDYELPALGMRGLLGQKKRSMVSSLLFSSRPGGYHEEGEPAMLAFPEQGSEDPVCLASGGLAALVRCPLALGGARSRSHGHGAQENYQLATSELRSFCPDKAGFVAKHSHVDNDS